MKEAPATLKRDLVGYSPSIALYGRTWSGPCAILSAKLDNRVLTFNELPCRLDQLRSLINVGDFEAVLGAHIDVYALYANAEDSAYIRVWHTAYTLGSIPESITFEE